MTNKEIIYIAKCKPLDKHRFVTTIKSKTLKGAVKRIRKESHLLGVTDYVWRVFALIDNEQQLLISGGHKFGTHFHQEWGRCEYTDDGNWLPDGFDNVKEYTSIRGLMRNELFCHICLGLAYQPSEYLRALACRHAAYIATHPNEEIPMRFRHITYFTEYYPEPIGEAIFEQQTDGAWIYKWNEE